ncbi:hypothetical protein O181_024744 [Austropuccinia psidii MF-1]|uniref:Uncharacterized protein n=1 Tax=Austropuccinia psidii MF-1 TaxID=1389203 RepID=A0A9Q3CJ82_9BASI|nr:hypothetical protein [Austropuccinia psidii MF-1]
MHLSTAGLLLTLSILSFVMSAEEHSGCYRHFLQTDHCVTAAVGKDRCKKNKKLEVNGKVLKFDSATSLAMASNKHNLTRRYDTYGKSYVAQGAELCGKYNSTTDPGACLLYGSTDLGWITSQFTKNCGKTLYVQRKGLPKTVKYVQVIDACPFSNKRPTDNCFEVAFTHKTFMDFEPTKQEIADSGVFNITWNFDNEQGNKPGNAPL